MTYCLSPHDRAMLERAYERLDWTEIHTLLLLDLARRARRVDKEDGTWTPSERRFAAEDDAA